MALIGIKVPEEISKFLKSIEVPGQKDPCDHITMFYIEGEMSAETVSKVCDILPKFRDDVVEVSIKKITTFPEGDDGVPIKADVISPGLIELRSRLSNLFDKNKIDYSKRFPDYNPHITLAYNDKKIKSIKLDSPIKWTVTEFMLWSGDTRSHAGTTIMFPLYEKKKMAFNILEFSERFFRLANDKI